MAKNDILSIALCKVCSSMNDLGRYSLSDAVLDA